MRNHHTLTREQAMENLARANFVRSTRKQWRDKNRRMSYEGGMERVVALMHLDEAPEWALTWRLRDVLMSVHYMGWTKVRQFMRHNLLHDELRVGSMSDRQKDLVINWARDRIARHGR
jgi:hypothetical protein